ncbi:hypothetical protein Calow_0836 [Caldicellulosiruptor owensensis OL]|uniref:HK97 gp10 family phage protein n=1 Tax=Caldicellulosiruptor owensensis (strain ATCC 700167 / DSM 13100 / OL) TaxID=632518 RepID=E4Q630_CALOW|nr:HK97 gp10 family phage protein [Caldicellulosiruptor owensensis]ADQ04404.1 hypothetical protein Calow_0836 [Caldicellulosiruptor owensensis OL]
MNTTAELKWNGDKVSKAVEQAVKAALQKCAADLQRKSAERAPIDTGDLRSNCSVSPLKREGAKFYHTVGYNLPYAIVQHERLDFRHPKGGEAKYLEKPFNENKSLYERYIGEAIRNALK